MPNRSPPIRSRENIRHASFAGLREDKDPTEVVRETKAVDCGRGLDWDCIVVGASGIGHGRLGMQNNVTGQRIHLKLVFPGTPGIHTAEQVAGWQKVTEAVHEAGGMIVLQLWHVGRISHRSHQPGGAPPVAPSAIPPAGGTYSADWEPVAFETPRALERQEIPTVVEQYRRGAELAHAAGFDGVEIHGANGYLIDQFLQEGANQRTDDYGGSIQNRTRFLIEVVDAVTSVWGCSRVGVRLSPFGVYNDMSDSDPIALFTHAIRRLDERGIAYLHLIEPRASQASETEETLEGVPDAATHFRHLFRNTLITAGGHTPETAAAAIAGDRTDAVAFGRLYISNPDLPERVRQGAALNPYDRPTFYGGDATGYTDYPALPSVANRAEGVMAEWR